MCSSSTLTQHLHRSCGKLITVSVKDWGLRAFITRDDDWLVSSWEQTRADLSSPLGTWRNLSKCISKWLKLFSLKTQWFINTSAGAGVMKAIWFEGICCQSTNGLIPPARFNCTLDFCGKQVILSSNAQKRTFPSGTLALSNGYHHERHGNGRLLRKLAKMLYISHQNQNKMEEVILHKYI